MIGLGAPVFPTSSPARKETQLTDPFTVGDGEVPAAVEYCTLRAASGLSPMTPSAAQEALPSSLYAVTVRLHDRLVAMGRVVGDGLHVQVVDIAVHPEYQGRGLSRIVMEHIMRFIDTSVAPCAVVSLLADVDWLYQKFGFEESRVSTAMVYRGHRQAR